MSKRILSVIMVLCLIMAMAPAAFATGEETFDTFDGTATIPTKDGDTYQIDSAEDSWVLPILSTVMSLMRTRCC